MARIAYVEPQDCAARELVERIVAERGSVLHLYRILLHSPAITQGWLGLLTAIRQQSGLPAELRELTIMRVATLNGAAYEASQHAPIALAEGLSREQIDALNGWREGDARFTPQQNAVLALTDAMTRDVQVADETWRPIRAAFDEKTIVELVATIAAYNMVSRLLEALRIHSDDPTDNDAPASTDRIDRGIVPQET
jgi:AhpD family alkylhydroperoxidase